MQRREFLETMGKVGGASALYGTMLGLGLLPSAAEARSTAGRRFELAGESGRGKKILILGAGLAGMGAAYELGKKGYDCHILEARGRPGGRCHTIRRGTTETEFSGITQKCDFDEGIYFNPGPARIPQHHVTLDYCRELGVAVEPFTQINEAAYYYHEGAEFGALSGQRVRAREAKADMTGYTHELLCKAVSQSALDADLTADDKERLYEFLKKDGALTDAKTYNGGGNRQIGQRRGFKKLPGAATVSGDYSEPFAFKELLRSGFGFDWMDDYEMKWQPTLFQIVGGTDGIAKAFGKTLGKRITYEAKVTEIRQSDKGVTVSYTDKDGKPRTASGDYCICAIPLSVLKTIPADFAPEVRSVIAATPYGASAKIGLQFKRRFWEEDDRIFGGITRTTLPITQIFYPSYGFLGRKGALVGFYNYEGDAVAVGKMTPAERLEFALSNGEKIHPQYRAELDRSFSVAWQETPFSKGAWVDWATEFGRGNGRGAGYETLTRPDGRIYLAGEHLSYITGWMAGALESARLVSQNIHARASAAPTP